MKGPHELEVEEKKQKRLAKLLEEETERQRVLAVQNEWHAAAVMAQENEERYTEREAEAKPALDEYFKAVHEVMTGRGGGYESFYSQGYNFFIFIDKMGDALRGQAPIALGRLADVLAGDNIIGYGVRTYVKPFVQEHIRQARAKPVEIYYYIDFVKDEGKETGYVGIQNLTRGDGQKLTREEANAVENEVGVWLKTKGYEPIKADPSKNIKEDPSRFVHTDGTLLNAKMFEDLRPGFAVFLTNGGKAIQAALDEKDINVTMSPLRFGR